MVPIILEKKPESMPYPVVRFAFQKRGALAWISHLDVLRTFNKALLRAGLPLFYTEGYSPRPKLVFATPLSLGQESISEYLDVRLTEEVCPRAAGEALRGTLPPELSVFAAGYPGGKFSSIAFSRYEIRLLTAGASGELAARCDARLHDRPLIVFKRSKAGDHDADISGGIREVFVGFSDGRILIDACLPADSAGFINPDYLVNYLREKEAILSSDPLTESARILRLSLFDAAGEEMLPEPACYIAGREETEV